MHSEDIKYEELEELPSKHVLLSNTHQKKDICDDENYIKNTKLGQSLINKSKKRKLVEDTDSKAKKYNIDRNGKDKKLQISPKRTSKRMIKQTVKAIEYSEQVICEVDDILPGVISTAEEFTGRNQIYSILGKICKY